MNRYTVIIPARAGSKRLKGKNTMGFCGKTLVEWAVDTAQALDDFIDIWITTDIERGVLDIDLPPDFFIPRPACLAQDDTPMTEVLKHAVGYIHGYTGIMPEHIILLQPTSPLRTVEDVKGCIDVYERWNTKHDMCSVYSYSPIAMNGAAYIYPVQYIFRGCEDHIPYRMPPERSIDIDTQADWDEAERLMRERLEGK